MRVLGIDPGYDRIGLGVVDKQGASLKVAWCGLVETPRIDLPTRLRLLHQETVAVLEREKPDCVAIERLFFAKNTTTAIDVAKAAGVLTLAAVATGLPVCEYAPPEIKQSVVGNGRAEKRQVQFMVTRLLGLAETPKPDDVADALAVAITHALRA